MFSCTKYSDTEHVHVALRHIKMHFAISQEDDKVLRLVSDYGAKKWTLIARHLKGRTGKQCRER